MATETPQATEVSADINERFESWLSKPEEVTEEVTEEKVKVEVEQAEEVTTEEPEEGNAEEETTEDSDDGNETLNIEGIDVVLPREVAEKVTTIQKRLAADYTKKTQEAAEMRKSAEASHEQLKVDAAFQQQNTDMLVQFQSTANQLKEYDGVDWGVLAEQDIGQYSKHKEIRDSLRLKQNEIHGELNARYDQALKREAQAYQQRWETTVSQVKKAIPSYDESMDKRAVETAVKLGEKYGVKVDPQNLSRNLDPLVWIGLVELSKYLDIVEKRPATNKQVAAKIGNSAKPQQSSERSKQIHKLLSQGRVREAAQL